MRIKGSCACLTCISQHWWEHSAVKRNLLNVCYVSDAVLTISVCHSFLWLLIFAPKRQLLKSKSFGVALTKFAISLILLFFRCNAMHQRWANNSVFEYIRIVRTEYIRKSNYSVLFKDRIIFVFVFGRYFQTEYIRIRIWFYCWTEYIFIRIQFLLVNRIYLYLYLVDIFKPNIFVFKFGFYCWTEYIRIRLIFIFAFFVEPNIFVFGCYFQTEYVRIRIRWSK